MFIIPVGDRVDWKKPPGATLLLILINCFVFFFLQSGDERREQKATQYYFSSALPDWELSRYAAYLEQQGPASDARRFQRLLQQRNASVLQLMEHDAKLMHELHSGQIVTAATPEFMRWKALRDNYESQRSITARYVFEVDAPSIFKAWTSAFLHGGFDHLLGNMLVLFLVGFLVESMVGKTLFLLAYLVSAVAAAYTFSLSAPGHSLLGASGAIAGVMGMYTLLFGARKIDFFYSLGFYFDYVRAPAIALLPLWLGNELYQFFSEQGSHVAYMAHFGGLLSGAAAGAMYRWKYPAEIKHHHQTAAGKEIDKHAFQCGMDYLGKMEFQKALSVFKSLQVKHPHDLNLAQLSYRAAKADPASDDYHQAALRLLSLPATDAAASEQTHTIFKEYLDCARPAHRLKIDLISSLARRFAGSRYCDDAEKLANVLLRTAPQHRELPAVLLGLARGYYREQRKDKFATTLQLLIQRFPQSQEAATAHEMLRVV